MKKSKKLKIIASTILILAVIFISIRHLIIFTDIITSTKKVAVCYSIPIENIFISEKLSPGMFVALNNEDLHNLEKKYGIDLSSKIKKYKEYKENDFTYFLQIHDPNSLVNYQDATDFITHGNKAYFIYEYKEDYIVNSNTASQNPDSSTLTGTRCSFAAVPKGAIDPNNTIGRNYYVDNSGNLWTMLNDDKWNPLPIS